MVALIETVLYPSLKAKDVVLSEIFLLNPAVGPIETRTAGAWQACGDSEALKRAVKRGCVITGPVCCQKRQHIRRAAVVSVIVCEMVA